MGSNSASAERDAPPTLKMPEAEAEAVRAAYRGASRIVEYGAGGSTMFAAAETTGDLLSIESDPDWVARVQAWLEYLGHDRTGIELRHVDIGPVGAWGMPKGPQGFRKYPNYPLSPWTSGASPDVVLIDGRFRLGCFAATLINIAAPVTVLWDDYADREGYHRAEKFVEPERMVGRMAVFSLAPRSLSPSDISEMIPWFSIPA